MRVEKGDRIEFTYTDKAGVTEDWKGVVTRAESDKDYFKLDHGGPHPLSFRYDRVQGKIRFLTRA